MEAGAIRALSPLIGRQSELRQFQCVLDSLDEQGRGQVVQIRGEAGIGKSRLVGAFDALAAKKGYA